MKGYEVAFDNTGSQLLGAYYNGPTTGSPSQLLADINNSANWITQQDYTGPTGTGSAGGVPTFVASSGPTVSSINRASGAATLTNATTDSFTVTFSQAVQGVSASNFQVAGSGVSGTVGTPTSSDGGTTWTVPVTSVAGNGTLALNLNSTSGITATSGGLALATTHNSDQTYTVDTTAPSITGVTLDHLIYKLGDTVTATIQLSGSYDGNGNYTLGSGSTLDGQTLTAGTFNSTNNTLTATFVANSGVTQVTNGTVADSIVVKDAAGNASATSSAGVASETIDTIAPAFSTATVNGNQLVLTYTEAGSGINSTDVPIASQFTVKDGGSTISVNSVTYNAANKTVTLGLASAVAHGDTVTVGYALNGTLAQELQDNAGNLAASLSNQAVTNNTPSPIPTVSVNSVSQNDVNSGTTTFNFTVSLSAASAQTVTVNYATSDGSAHAPSDYVSTSGTVTFSPGQTSQTIPVTVNGGTLTSPTETFSVTLSSPTNATIATGTGTGTIDDVPPTVTSGNISLSGGTGIGGAFKIGDTVTATWNNSSSGDNNTDTINAGGVTMNFSPFGGGSAVLATNSSGIWTATYVVTSGAIDSSSAKVAVTATDKAGSLTTASSSAVTVDDISPVVTSGHINLSGGSGTGGAFKIGDTVTATWNDSSGGDNNTDTINAGGVTFNFSQFGGGSAVVATNSGGIWTATYTITAGSINTTNAHVAVTATDHVGNATTTSSTAVSVDDVAPIVTAPNISVSGGSGTGGAFKIGDTVTATWNNSGSGDNNTDTINGGVTVDFSQFGGGTAVVATNSGGIWTATYTISAGSIDTANAHVAVTATDSVGNATTTSGGAVTADNEQPVVSAANISVSGGSGIGGAFKIGDTVTAAWNNSGVGDNNTDVINAGGVTMNFAQFGGGSAVVATNSGGIWTATYTVTSGAIDTSTAHVAVTATDHVGNSRTTSGSAVTVDSTFPAVTTPNISVSGGSGTGGAFKIGDTVTATWNDSGTGDNNTDTINAGGVTFNFSQFGGGSAVVATNSGGIWTAAYTVTSGAIDTSTAHVAVTATDHVGNSTTTSGGAVTIDNIFPTVTTPNISVSGGSGTGGAFKIGDTVTATWNDSGAGDNNTDTINAGGVTFNFSQFGGGSAVVATNSGGVWTATYTITSGAIDTSTAHVAVTATDHVGNSRTTSGGAVSVDDTYPVVTSGHINLSGGSGTGGAFKIGDTVTATWNNSGAGDNNTDTINAGGVTFNFSQFGGGSAVVATNSGGIWTATYTITAGSINTTNAHVAVTATDHVGNATTTSGSAATIDDIAPVITAANISLSGGSGTGGAFKIGDTVTATWNDSGTGDNNTDTINAGGVTFNFAEFGSGSAVVATNSGGIWTATYTIAAGGIDTANAHVAVTATDSVGNAVTTVGSAVTADDKQPIVTAPHISVSGGSGPGGAFKIGDTVTATWNNSGAGDNNTDIINAGGVTMNFAQFGGGSAVVATNSGGIWTATYTITAGSIKTTNAHVAVTVTDHVGNATTTPGAAVTVDDVYPNASSVTASTDNGHTDINAGHVVSITVDTNEAVSVTGTPTLQLNDGENASYVSGSGGSALIFSYTVQPGDTQSDLKVTGYSGTIADLAGNSLAPVSADLHLQVDTTAPTASSVTASTDNGHADINAGHVVTITIDTNEAVTVTGTPTLQLNDGETASYVSGSGGSALAFSYTVKPGDTQSDLKVTGYSGTIADLAGNSLAPVTADLHLQVDTTAPTASSVTASTDNGHTDINAGHVATITVDTNEAVTVAGTPTLQLNDGETASYVSGSGGTALIFSYTVQPGDTQSDLQVSGYSGTITDLAGNSLAPVSADLHLQVDTTAPTATAAATPSSGIEGFSDIVKIALSFGEAVAISGATPELSLNTGGHAIYDATATAALHDASKLVFDYTVGAADSTVTSLAVTGVTAGTTITDLAGNNANVAASFAGLQVISSVLTANPDSNHVTANQAVSADAAHGVLANDTDTNPTDHLFVSAVAGLAGDVNQPIAGAYGTLTLHADGSYSYFANNMSVGVGVDNFVYTMNDGHGQTATSTLAIAVIGANESYTQVAAGGSATTGFGNAVLDGSAGNAALTGGATLNAHPVLIGGPGDTLSAGNYGQDTFVFNNNFGHDIITNFHPALDVIQLQLSQFGSLSNVLADIQQVGADSVLTLDANHVITLTNVQHGSLTAADFHLV